MAEGGRYSFRVIVCQHAALRLKRDIKSEDCDITIAEPMGSRDAFPIPFLSFIYDPTNNSLHSLYTHVLCRFFTHCSGKLYIGLRVTGDNGFSHARLFL